ncbi:MAG: hypothetical protein ACRD8W_02240 [Nitrososphaeraceae archaeon]
MKIFTVGLIIISALVMGSMVLTPSIALQASSKGLKLYLTVDTNLNDDVIINTYQYGDRVFTHDAVIHSDSNVVTLQYPSGLIDTDEFRICVRTMNYDKSACDTGYNSEAKQPEHLFISLFADENRNSPNAEVDNSQAQSHNQDNEQSQSQSQNNEQTTTIINCPPDSRCVIEQ